MFDAIPDMAWKRAELTPDDIAFHDTTTGKSWTFFEVNRAADGVAEGLRQDGFAAGDRLGIICFNRAEFFVTLFACQKIGVILCPLNWRQPAPELIATLRPIGVRGVIHDEAHRDVAREVTREVGARLIGFDEDLAIWIAKGGPALTGDVPTDSPWYLLFTSGTTGRPKAVIQTARMSWANAVNAGQAIGLTSQDKAVNFLPLFHTAGINLYTLPVFLNGAMSTIFPKFDEAGVISLIRSGGVTQFFGVPAIYQSFSLMPDIDEIEWAGITCGCGGAPLAEPLVQFFADRGAMVMNGFGMTETGPCALLMDPKNVVRKIGSAGKAQILTEIRLEGVPEGEVGQGEIQLRGPGITPGYFNDPKATAETFTPDGWLHTGDIGRRDEDGYYFVVDRIKDMFISGGENVYPAEVERVLEAHPDLLEIAVIGVPDEKWGEVGAAFIMLRPEAVISRGEIRAWCRERMAAFKVPAHLRIVTDFPRTAAGKIRKTELRLETEHA